MYLLKTVASSQRMINGSDASYKEFPSYVEVLLCEDGKCLHHCGGAVLKSWVILTACHCVANISIKGKIEIFDEKKIFVVAGVDDYQKQSPNKQMVGAKEILLHRRCAYRTTMEYDTAVVALTKNLVFNVRVQPIKMHSEEDTEILMELYKLAGARTQCITMGNREEDVKGEFDDDEEIEILGEIERTLGNNVSSTGLIMGNVNLITSRTCARTFCDLGYENLCNHNFQVFGQICVMPEASESCHSDGGSPMICEGKLFGLASWGPRCSKDYPLVYAYISSVPKMLEALQTKMNSPHRKQRNSSASCIFSSFITIMLGQFLITSRRK